MLAIVTTPSGLVFNLPIHDPHCLNTNVYSKLLSCSITSAPLITSVSRLAVNEIRDTGNNDNWKVVNTSVFNSPMSLSVK